MTRFLFLISIISILFFINYSLILTKKNHQVINDAKKIEALLEVEFNKSDEALRSIGTRFAKDTPKLELKIIHQIFLEEAKKYPDNIWSWSLFDWVNIDGHQSVNTLAGIRKNLLKVSNRNYRSRANQDWVLIFSKSDIGNASKVLVIPIGMQISTTKYPRAGTIALGIDIKKLTKLINSNLSKNIYFAIIDKRDDSLVCSSNSMEDYLNSISLKKLDFINDRLIFYKEMDEKYPYKILTGYNRTNFWQEALSLFLAISIPFAAIILLTVILRKKRTISK